MATARGPLGSLTPRSYRAPLPCAAAIGQCHRWYHTYVDKTTVYLPIELKTALRRVARERGVSEAEVIRDSIRRAVAGARPAPRPGVFAGTEPIARDADRHLRGFGER